MNNADKGGERLCDKRSGGLMLLAVITAAVILCMIFSSQIIAAANKYMIPCPLLVVTGIRCPLCGGTRCIKALTGFDIGRAIYYNPLVVMGVFCCIYMYIRLAVSCIAKNYKPYKPKIGERGLWIILVVYLLFFLVRNLPFYKAWFY